MITSQILIGLFFTHWVGDFVLQSRWMGNNKSKNWKALTAHVATYTAILLQFALIVNIHHALVFTFINGIVHLITDAITSRITSNLYKANKIYAFFTVIGFDQFIHCATLVLTLQILLG